jgi:hypothetical protein
LSDSNSDGLLDYNEFAQRLVEVLGNPIPKKLGVKGVIGQSMLPSGYVQIAIENDHW